MSDSKQSEIVVVGGGAVGCGVAYQLAQAGHTDVLVIEKEPTLAAATSSQAAGLVGQVRNSIERTRLAMWSVKTFSQLQEDERAPAGWRQVGSLRIALNEKRIGEFSRMAEIAAQAGLEVEFIEPAAASEKWPLLDFRQVQAVLWCPSDGYLQPSDLTQAYATLARRRGVRFRTDTPVRGLLREGARVVGVRTDEGDIACETVIDAAGAHAYHLARCAGLELPIVPVRHEFLVTATCEGLHPELPVMRIPDISLYLRAETHQLLTGGWEPNSLAHDPRSYPIDAPEPRVESDWEVLAAFAQSLTPYLPAAAELGFQSVFKGLPTFTPDGRFIVGESARAPGFVMAGGCNAHGVSGSAGLGRHVVESILEDEPSEYVQSLSPERFLDGGWDWESAIAGARKVYETYYGIAP